MIIEQGRLFQSGLNLTQGQANFLYPETCSIVLKYYRGTLQGNAITLTRNTNLNQLQGDKRNRGLLI